MEENKQEPASEAEPAIKPEVSLDVEMKPSEASNEP